MMLAAVPMSMTTAAHLALAAAVGIARFTSIKLPQCSQGRKAYATHLSSCLLQHRGIKGLLREQVSSLNPEPSENR